ncbi:MAG: BatA domain-containing protein, partial [Verrucomicrobia bacterium]|nr:BatA domain-containing protein [Verrucomicrobiota bacterium]
MMPIFANPAGWWALLGGPAILAIQFLQQRARVARTSPWFLIEKLAPDSARGRMWDRLRTSRTLWLQLAAVIVAAWVLSAPRWVRSESAQTVVVVLDASASMEAFRESAVAAAEEEMNAATGLASRTTWVVMTTNPRQPPLYRGVERTAASAALARWLPELGEHDLGPALRIAHGAAGAMGRTLLITDTRAKVPPGQRAAGVGRPIENVGFAGASVTREGGAYAWRALVKNHAATAQSRTWRIESPGGQSAEQSLTLAPGVLTEISARLPDGVESATVVLAADAFAADDRLPLVRPAPKPLVVQVDGTDAPAEFFRKIARDVEGVAVVSAGAATTLRLARLAADEVAKEPHGGIFWPPEDKRAQAPLMTEPVTPERDPLVASLNWQGWFGTGAYGFAPAPGDSPLLWQSRWQIVFLRPAPAGGRKLMLAFDWATSNAARLPATVLLARRFLEAERDAQRAPYAANFDCGATVALAGVPADG